MRSGSTPWASPHITISGDGSRLDEQLIDVVVVGAGISGACVAHALAAQGRPVVMLDRALPAQGSTMASTALITWELDLPLHLLSRSLGAEAAGVAWTHSLDSLRALRDLVERERIACDWDDRSSLYLAGSAHGHRALRAEVAMRAGLGLPGTFVSSRQLRDRYGLDRTGAVHAEGMAVADPVKLTSGILRATQGLQLHCPVEVTAVRRGENSVTLETSRGPLRARTVVFCTGYALLDGLPSGGLSVDSTWAIATPPSADRPTWLDSTIVWEASDPYLYLRSTSDGRVIVGGLDEDGEARYTDREALARKAKRIAVEAGRLLGVGPLDVDCSWAGAFGSSESGLPVIGPVPGIPGCFVVAGFGGNGITHAMLAARLVTGELQARPLPLAGLYHPVNTPGEADSVA